MDADVAGIGELGKEPCDVTSSRLRVVPFLNTAPTFSSADTRAELAKHHCNIYHKPLISKESSQRICVSYQLVPCASLRSNTRIYQGGTFPAAHRLVPIPLPLHPTFLGAGLDRCRCQAGRDRYRDKHHDERMIVITTATEAETIVDASSTLMVIGQGQRMRLRGGPRADQATRPRLVSARWECLREQDWDRPD